MITLRPDQQVVLDRTRAAVARRKRPIMVAPCGWGKGTTFAKIVHGAIEREKSVLFLINNTTILRDFSKRLDRIGVDHGVIQADHPRCRPWLRTQVAMIQTLHRRENLPKADLLLIDEAHFATAPTWASVLERYRGVPIVGATATPQGPNGLGLGGIFDELIFGPSTIELIELGLLVPVRAYAPPPPEGLDKVDITAGERNMKQAAAIMDKPKLVGDSLDHWLRFAAGRPTVGFATTVEHSKHLRDTFVAGGIRAEHADAKTPPDVRDALWEDLAKGRVQVAWNVGLTTYGWDCPAVSCVILERPTESLTLFRQMVGREQRPCEGKADAILLDHAGAVHRHGLIEDDPEWDLEGNCGGKGKPRDAALSVRMCIQCWAAFRSTERACPACGWQYVARTQEIKVADGQLQEITESAAGPKPYKIKHLSGDPIRAYFQQEAEKLGRSHRWMWKMSELAKEGSMRVPAEVFDAWQAYERGKRGAA